MDGESSKRYMYVKGVVKFLREKTTTNGKPTTPVKPHPTAVGPLLKLTITLLKPHCVIWNYFILFLNKSKQKLESFYFVPLK